MSINDKYDHSRTMPKIFSLDNLIIHESGIFCILNISREPMYKQNGTYKNSTVQVRFGAIENVPFHCYCELHYVFFKTIDDILQYYFVLALLYLLVKYRHNKIACFRTSTFDILFNFVGEFSFILLYFFRNQIKGKLFEFLLGFSNILFLTLHLNYVLTFWLFFSF